MIWKGKYIPDIAENGDHSTTHEIMGYLKGRETGLPGRTYIVGTVERFSDEEMARTLGGDYWAKLWSICPAFIEREARKEMEAIVGNFYDALPHNPYIEDIGASDKGGRGGVAQKASRAIKLHIRHR